MHHEMHATLLLFRLMHIYSVFFCELCHTDPRVCVSVHMTTASDRWTRLWSRRTSRSRFHTDATAESVSESHRSVCHRSRICVCFSSLTLLCCSSSLGSRREALHRRWRYVARQSQNTVMFCCDLTSCVVSLQLAWWMKTTGGIWESCSSTSAKSRLKVRPQIRIMRLQSKALQSEHGIKYCMHYTTMPHFSVQASTWASVISTRHAGDNFFKGSYVAISNIIIWCNTICRHALM